MVVVERTPAAVAERVPISSSWLRGWHSIRSLRRGAAGGVEDRSRCVGARGSSAIVGGSPTARWAGIAAACAGIGLSCHSPLPVHRPHTHTPITPGVNRTQGTFWWIPLVHPYGGYSQNILNDRLARDPDRRSTTLASFSEGREEWTRRVVRGLGVSPPQG